MADFRFATLLFLLVLCGPPAQADALNSVLPNIQNKLLMVQDGEGPTEEELLDEGKHKITFRPFHLSILKKGRVRGTVDIQLVLQLHDNRDYESLNLLKPQLRSDITAALSTLARRRWRVTKPIDPDIVSDYLTPFIEHRVGPDRLNVYVLQALINPA